MKNFDIKKHTFVPKHTKLSEKDKQELLEKYNINLTQLPRIMKKDPALEGLNVKSGDVIKIVRKSPTAGESEYYRVVVSG